MVAIAVYIYKVNVYNAQKSQIYSKHSQRNNIANTTKLISALIREHNPGAKQELVIKRTALSQLDFWLSDFSTLSLAGDFPLSSSSKTTRPSEPRENM